MLSGKTPFQRVKSGEIVADIIAARLTGKRFVDIMNVPNVGQIPGLPMGSVVETYGVVNATGFHASAVGPLPPALLPTLLPHCVNADLTVEAGMTGDREKALQALANDPLCAHLSLARVRKMADEMLKANRRYLPQFCGKRR